MLRLNCFNVTAICFAEVDFVVGQFVCLSQFSFGGARGLLEEEEK